MRYNPKITMFLFGVLVTLPFAVHAKAKVNPDIDRNRDGIVTKDERSSKERPYYIQKNGRYHKVKGTKKEVVRRSPVANPAHVSFNSRDINDDGVVSLSEWGGTRVNFYSRDRDRDGNLSRTEFFSATNDELRGSFKDLDLNRNGFISPREWSGTLATFNILDTNDDGSLSTNELNQNNRADSFGRLDSNSDGWLQSDEWLNNPRVFQNLDRNHDGRLSLLEFNNRQYYSNSVFRELDTNDDGKVTGREWRDNNETFTRLDVNKNNSLSEGEFTSQQSVGIVERMYNAIFNR